MARADGVALRGFVWDDTTKTSSDRVTGTQGKRLEIRRDVLQELLVSTGRSMIVEVMIDRTHKDHKQLYSVRYGQDNGEFLPSRERPCKIYLFDESG